MKFYNSLSKRKEGFKPIKDRKVTIYVCGITPEGPTHLGHAFTYISFDVLIRFLKFKKYEVNYVQNVTDIDDDILRKAKEENNNWRALGEYWTKKFLKDLNFLNILPPTHYIKATDSIKKIIEIDKDLTRKEFAYEKNGNVYFDVKKIKDYGKLSEYSEKQMILLSRERGANPSDPFKKHPLDFILWQKLQKGEPFWESPWGKGRPGWHIECSAMINTYLGDQIDIHGGGRDLIFPHHESEIAQSESFTGKKPFVKYWMHTAMVLYEGEKMSKSLGNLILISDLLKKYCANTIRFLLLNQHYRDPWECDYSKTEEANKKMEILEELLKQNENGEIRKNIMKKFEAFMEDDLDTKGALDFMLEISKNKDNIRTIKKILEILGFVVK